MNIILDTNVLIAGILNRGSERKILDLVISNKFNIVYSKDVLTEYILAPSNMILNADLSKVNKKQLKQYAYLLSKTISDFIFDKAQKINVTSTGKYLKDSSDDKFINLAIDSNVKYIISVDEHLFADIDIKNKKGENITVISPYNFVSLARLLKKCGS